MRLEGDKLVSPANPSLQFQIDQGILRAFLDSENSRSDITETIHDFYEDCNFPNYESGETISSLLRKSRSRPIADFLNRAIPPHASVLEVGCGTGQLGNFLSLSKRGVISVDLSMGSLREAQKFKTENQLKSVLFCRMNLFRMPLAEKAFDFVICTGVLHHTPDPQKGFESLLRHLRPGGYVVIGLYNRAARIKTWLRGPLLRTSTSFDFLDPYLRESKPKGKKRAAWILDQYHNPHESWHSMDDVLGWFRKSGIEFVRSFPSTEFFEQTELDRKISPLSSRPVSTHFERCLVQLRQAIFDRDGGLFIMIGKRPSDP